MKYALTINEERRILSATFTKYANKNAILKDKLPTGETDEHKNIHNWLIDENGEYVFSPIVVEIPIEQKITELKTELASTDYKIIKCSEASLLGEELPYDIITLHAERQALRDEINALEAQ